MKSNKLTALACAAAMMLSAAGCGSGDESGEVKTLGPWGAVESQDDVSSKAEEKTDSAEEKTESAEESAAAEDVASDDGTIKLASPDDIAGFVEDFNNGNNNLSDGDSGWQQSFVSSPENPITPQNMTLDDLTCGCRDCAEIVLAVNEIYTGLAERSKEEGTIDPQQYFADQFSRINAHSDHNCTAQQVYVQNMKTDIDGYVGYYTGEWLGTGPCGYGSFAGSTPNCTRDERDNLYTYSDYLSYTGYWDYNMPSGQGDLYYYHNKTNKVNGFAYNYEQFFTGEFQNGRKNGVGVQHEIQETVRDTSTEYTEWFYDQGTYVNGDLAENVKFAQYNEKGDPKFSGIATGVLEGPGRGIVEYKQRMHSDTFLKADRDKAIKDAALWFTGLAAVAAGAYLASQIGGGADYYSTQDSDTAAADLDYYFAQKEEEAKRNEAEQERIKQENEKYWYNKAEEYDKKGLLDTIDGQWFAANGHYKR